MERQDLKNECITERINQIIEQIDPKRIHEYYEVQEVILESLDQEHKKKFEMLIDDLVAWGMEECRAVYGAAFFDGLRVVPNIMPITELSETDKISKLCHKSKRPIFITKDGYGDLAVMSFETYEKLICLISSDPYLSEAGALSLNELPTGDLERNQRDSW